MNDLLQRFPQSSSGNIVEPKQFRAKPEGAKIFGQGLFNTHKSLPLLFSGHGSTESMHMTRETTLLVLKINVITETGSCCI